MNAYEVWISKVCLDSEHSSELYGPWSETWYNTFGQIGHKLDREPWDKEIVTSELYFGHGEDCYVVWVEYSTGDSFGWGSHNRTDVISVHKTRGAAESVQEFINDMYVNKKNEYTTKFTSKDGQKLDIYTGAWTGYFEELNNIHIEHTIMSPRSITVTP